MAYTLIETIKNIQLQFFNDLHSPSMCKFEELNEITSNFKNTTNGHQLSINKKHACPVKNKY